MPFIYVIPLPAMAMPVTTKPVESHTVAKTTFNDLPVDILLYLAEISSLDVISRLMRTNKNISDLLERDLYRHDVSRAKSAGQCARALAWAVFHCKHSQEMRLRVTKKSIDAGADVNAPYLWELIGSVLAPPVLGAAMWQSAAQLQLLLDAGADINAEHAPGVCAISYTVNQPHHDVLEKIFSLPELDWNRTGYAGYGTLLSSAAALSNIDAMVRLLERVDPNERESHLGYTALYRAVKAQSLEAVLLLLAQERLDPNMTFASGPSTALALADTLPNRLIRQALLEDNRTPNMARENRWSAIQAFGATASQNMRYRFSTLRQRWRRH